MKNNQTLPKSGFHFTCGSEDPHPVRDEILVETHAFPLPSARFCVVATQNLARNLIRKIYFYQYLTSTEVLLFREVFYRKVLLYKFIITALFLISLVLPNHSAFSQQIFPKKKWQQFSNVEEAGFSLEKVQLIKEKFEESEGAALLVVSNGKILLSWGDNTRKYMVHSIRKSFMNAMIGREINQGTLSLDQTLEQLSIDDIGKLTPKEKTATVADLL
ncbi:MAG: hypothetical protein KDD99_14030, partial [Bacteroidetes bacterium]|nr:hypothetical protein [Bacteroidota bacterium]